MKLTFIALASFLVWSCSFFAAGIELDKEFTLKQNEEAVYSPTDLKLTMLKNGREQGEDGDMVFCEVRVKADGKSNLAAIRVGASYPIGDLLLKVQSVDIKVDTSKNDPWAESSCTFIVTKAKK
ncbi:MAG: hypothetical protein KF685_04155 [Acidobacteria bacterium]|nr:hypothetical protein [Acidobacteriota bacterium]